MGGGVAQLDAHARPPALDGHGHPSVGVEAGVDDAVRHDLAREQAQAVEAVRIEVAAELVLERPPHARRRVRATRRLEDATRAHSREYCLPQRPATSELAVAAGYG